MDRPRDAGAGRFQSRVAARPRRAPARPLAPGPRLLLLFSPLQLGLKQPRRKPRGFFFFFFEGVVVKTPEVWWQEGGSA